MTGIKIAVYAGGMIGGVSTSITTAIMANLPAPVAEGAISSGTPVNLTLALVAGGITTTAVLAWKVSRAWANMENEVKLLRAEVTYLKGGTPPPKIPPAQ